MSSEEFADSEEQDIEATAGGGEEAQKRADQIERQRALAESRKRVDEEWDAKLKREQEKARAPEREIEQKEQKEKEDVAHQARHATYKQKQTEFYQNNKTSPWKAREVKSKAEQSTNSPKTPPVSLGKPVEPVNNQPIGAYIAEKITTGMKTHAKEMGRAMAALHELLEFQ